MLVVRFDSSSMWCSLLDLLTVCRHEGTLTEQAVYSLGDAAESLCLEGGASGCLYKHDLAQECFVL